MKSLCRALFAYCLILFNTMTIPAFAQAQEPSVREIENISTFANVYGYVRFFHPSDEAAALDWDRFAIYGAQQVEDAKNAEELRERLVKLFHPIAPTLVLYNRNGPPPEFSMASITPPDTAGYQVVTWQHLGVDFGHINNIYKSSRLNRPDKANRPQAFGTTGNVIDAKSYRGKDFILSAKLKVAKGPGTGHLWARVDIGNGQGFFENMDDRPVKLGKDWETYEIAGKIDAAADRLVFGIFLTEKGALYADDLLLRIREDDEWVVVHSNTFEKESEETLQSLTRSQAGYVFRIQEARDGNNTVLSISDDPNGREKSQPEQLFSKYARPGEYIDKEIGSGLSCILPLALFGTEESTFPIAEKRDLNELKKALTAIPPSGLTGESRHARLGSLVITWNVFQHFYPYFNVIDTDWEAEFRKALSEAYHDRTNYDFLKTLQKFTATLQDGHVYVSLPANIQEAFLPPVDWEWIENKLVITHVMGDSIPLRKGDVITSVNGRRPEEYFKEVYSYISAATTGWRDHRAKLASLQGSEGSELELEAITADGSETKVHLIRNLTRPDYWAGLPKKDVSRELSPGIFYLNLDAATNEDIDSLGPQLEKAKGIIFDLRGYPKSGYQYLTHLLHERDTSSMWMRVPQIIYPDQEHIASYRVMGWNMTPQEPHIDAKRVFITDGSAISYAESYLSFVEHYKLATIVGQPTAGTNGNINPFVLPGGYRISWTGMKVLKHDGSQHHGVGITPDVYVNKTVAGVRQGRDEFLEKAIDIIIGEIKLDEPPK